MQNDPDTEHTNANEQEQQDAEVFGNISTEEAFRNRILENKRRLIDDMNAMPEVNDEDIAELEAIHAELMAKKQTFDKAEQLRRQIEEATNALKNIQQQDRGYQQDRNGNDRRGQEEGQAFV